MAAIPKYVFVVEDSDGKTYEFEKATEKAWEWYENDVGRCRFFVPYNDLKLSSASLPDDALSEIRIYRDGVLVWQGVLQYVQDTENGTLVFGETFLSTLGWYGVRYNQKHSDAAIGTIIDNEYDDIVGRSNNFISSKITKGTIQNPYVNGTTDNLTITRTLYNDNFLDFLKEMMAVARGEMVSGERVSWNQYAVFEVTFHEVTPSFNFWRDVGVEKTTVKFALGSEIIDYTLPKDFRTIFNETKGFAVQEGPKVLTNTQSETANQADWYRREAYPYFGQVTNQGELDQRTQQFSRELKDPRRDLLIKFASGMKPFDGYSMGESVKIVINRGRTNISEYRRVIGMYVNIENTGVEQTTPVLEKPRS